MIVMVNIHFTQSTVDENSSHCLSYLISQTEGRRERGERKKKREREREGRKDGERQRQREREGGRGGGEGGGGEREREREREIVMANIHFTQSTVDENSSHCISYLISEHKHGKTIQTN